MLDTSLSSLLGEIEAGEQARDQRLESLHDQITRYHGPWYDGEGPGADMEPDPENHAYSFLSAFIPATVHAPPRVSVSSRRPTAQKDVAAALESAVNRWVRDTCFIETLEELAYDFYFRWAVCLTSVRPRPESYGVNYDPILMPAVTRISPKDFGWDAMSKTPTKARIQFHRWRIDKDDLIHTAEEDRKLPKKDRAGWNLKVIKSLTTGVEPREDEDHHDLEREQVELYDVYIAEDQPDPAKGPEQGFFGSVRTIAVGHAARSVGDKEAFLVRKARPHFGPSPYAVGGCYLVPDKSFPLSPLVAVQAQSDTLNSFVSSMIRDAETMVNKIVMGGVDPQVIDRINSSPHNHIAIVDDVIDLKDKIQMFAMGGVDPQRFGIANWMRDMLERISGFNDVSQGQVTGDGTATEVSFAQDAASARADYPGIKFVRFVEDVLKKVAEFFYRTEQIIMPLGREGLEAASGGDPSIYPDGMEAWFFGGTTESGSGGTFQDLELVLDASSMRRTSEAQLRRRSEVLVEFTTMVLPIWMQIPGLKLRKATQKYGDFNNVPDIMDVLDFDKLLQEPMVPPPMVASQAGTMSAGPGFYDRAPILARQAAKPEQTLGQQNPPGRPAEKSPLQQVGAQ